MIFSESAKKTFLSRTAGVLYSFQPPFPRNGSLGEKSPEYFWCGQCSSVGSRLTSVMTHSSRAFLAYGIQSILLNCCGDHTTLCTSRQARGRLWNIQEPWLSSQAFSLSEGTKKAMMASDEINRRPSWWNKLLFHDRLHDFLEMLAQEERKQNQTEQEFHLAVDSCYDLEKLAGIWN